MSLSSASVTVAEPWPVPDPGAPRDRSVRLPGSKSLTNRALVLAALASDPGLVRHPLRSRDTLLMVDALRALGVGVDEVEQGWRITPGLAGGGAPLPGPANVDCGLAGTVMRFVPPVAALATGSVAFDGDEHMRNRPVGEILEALRALGAQIDDGGRGALPFTLTGTGAVAGGTVTIDASASSQFVSALLLAGARYDAGVDVLHDGKPVPSQPHIDMTVEMLREHGVSVDVSEPNRWSVAPGPVAALDRTIEPDLSNAAPFLMLAAAAGGSVTVLDWPASTTQPGDQLRSILATMGCTTTLDDEGLTVARTGPLHGIVLDMHDVGELTPAVAALCALAESPSHLYGIGHIRAHETDRLAALTTELTALGADVVEEADGLRIRPAPLHAGVFHTYADHRMAHAGVILGSAVPGIEVENIATTAKTFPDFAGAWTRFLAGGGDRPVAGT